MGVTKRFRQQCGDHLAEIEASVGWLRFEVNLWVDDELVERRTGMLNYIDDLAGGSTAIVLRSGTVIASIKLATNSVSVTWWGYS